MYLWSYAFIYSVNAGNLLKSERALDLTTKATLQAKIIRIICNFSLNRYYSLKTGFGAANHAKSRLLKCNRKKFMAVLATLGCANRRILCSRHNYHFFFLYVYVWLSIFLCIYQSFYIYIYQSIYQSIFTSIHLSII